MPSKKIRVLIVVLILVGAFCARLGVSLISTEGQIDDRDAYFVLGWNIALTGTFVDADGSFTAFRPALYPIALAAVIKAFGTSGAGVYILNALLGSVSVFCVYLITKRLVGPAAAALAAAAAAIEPYLVLISADVMSESLFIPLGLLVIYFVLAADGGSRSKAVLAGVFLALLVLCRPEGIVFILPVLIGFLALKKNPSLCRTSVIIFLSVFCAIYSSWVCRNYLRFNAFIPFTTHGGYTLYLGNNESFYESASRGRKWDDSGFKKWTQMNNAETGQMDELEKNDYFYEKAKEFIRGNPRRFFHLMWLKLVRFWRLYPHGVSGVIAGMAGAYTGLLYVLSIAGAVVLFAKKKREFLIIIMPIIFICIVHMIYWSQIRFRVPLHPLFVILSFCFVFRKSLRESAFNASSPQ